MEYTPGPWIIKWDFNIYAENGDRGIASIGYSNNYDPNVYATNKANARLIALAPEFFEVCKDFVAFDWENSNLHWPTIAMWISRFQNIIAKAEVGE